MVPEVLKLSSTFFPFPSFQSSTFINNLLSISLWTLSMWHPDIGTLHLWQEALQVVYSQYVPGQILLTPNLTSTQNLIFPGTCLNHDLFNGSRRVLFYGVFPATDGYVCVSSLFPFLFPSVITISFQADLNWVFLNFNLLLPLDPVSIFVRLNTHQIRISFFFLCFFLQFLFLLKNKTSVWFWLVGWLLS